MPRTTNLIGFQDSIYLGQLRNPRLQVLIYDNTETIDKIVLTRATQIPFDITDLILNLTITEEEDNASGSTITLIARDIDEISPYLFIGRKLIKILYRELGTDEFDTPEFTIFFGVIVGQPGFTRNRSSLEQTISLKCVDRSFFYNRKIMESPTYAQGTDFGDVLIDMGMNATYGFNLQREEIRFGKFNSTVQHTIVQFFDVPYMEALGLIGFVFDKKPDFDSQGFLVMRDTSFTKPPVRTYTDESLFLNIAWQQNDADLNNRVIIKGLSNVVSKIVSPTQILATVTGTVGYFMDEYKVRVFYGEDHDTRAEALFISDRSINGQLDGILGGKAKLQDIGEFSCVLVISTPYNSYVFIVFFTVYIAFFVLSFFSSFLPGLGDIAFMAAAIWLCAGLAIMQMMGNFEVVISGNPFRMIYKEIEAIAQWENLAPHEIREIEIENHLIHTQELADSIAKRELIRETAKGNIRSLTLPHDPVLEKNDIIELPDGSRYFINSISRSFNKRGEPYDMEVSAIMIRNGKEFNNLPGFSLY